MHTYIIGHYNPSVRIIDLVSHTTYIVCVNFIHKWWDLQFKVDFERQIFWETFHCNFIYSQSFCQKSAERKSPKKYFFRISFWCLVWDLNPGFSSNKPTHYILDHGDFDTSLKIKKQQISHFTKNLLHKLSYHLRQSWANNTELFTIS